VLPKRSRARSNLKDIVIEIAELSPVFLYFHPFLTSFACQEHNYEIVFFIAPISEKLTKLLAVTGTLAAALTV
jgi:hypothetical protein